MAGRLEETCILLSEDLARKASEATAKAMVYLRVILVVLTGIIVGFFVMAMYMPYFDIPIAVMGYSD